MKARISLPAYRKKMGYTGAEITFPAEEREIWEAMDVARIAGKDYVLCDFYGWPSFLGFDKDWKKISVDELNFLAKRIEQMKEAEYWAFEAGVCFLKLEHQGREIPLRDLINLSYNTDCFEVMPGICNDQMLGEVAIDADSIKELEAVPDEIVKLLDLEKVGRYVREQEQGVFSSAGYCLKNTVEWKEVYDGKKLPQKGNFAMLSLCLGNSLPFETDPEIWIDLPKTEDELKTVFSFLDVTSWKECSITNVKSRIPQLRLSIGCNENLEQLNQYVLKLEKMGAKELLKYKAVLEYEECSSLAQAETLLESLGAYTFDPDCISYAEYGQECLENVGVDCDDPAFLDFDFERFGKNQCNSSVMAMTSYGMVIKEPELEEIQSEEQGLGMGGMT